MSILDKVLAKVLVSVPDFRATVEKEVKDAPPPFYEALTPAEKDAYNRSVATSRSIVWACGTAASAYNLGIMLSIAYLVTNGAQLWALISTWLHKP